jgi:hypothetical protein
MNRSGRQACGVSLTGTALGRAEILLRDAAP